MPYVEQSPFGAAADVVGGMGQGMAQQAAINAQLQLEQRRQKAEEAYQQFDMRDRTIAQQIARGIDPDTSKPITSEMPKTLTEVAPNNKGQAATLQQQYDHAMKVGGFFLSRGFKNQAQPYFDQAANYADIMGQQVAFQRDLQKLAIAAQIHTTQFGQEEAIRHDDAMQLEGVRAGVEQAIHQSPTYADLHPRPGVIPRQYQDAISAVNTAQHQTDQWFSTSIARMNSQNDAVKNRVVKDINGDLKQADAANPGMAEYEKGLQRMIRIVQTNPAKTDDLIGQVMGLKTLTDSQKTLAVEAIRRYGDNAAAMKKAQSALQQAQTGGSDAGADPQYPGP